MAQQKKKNVRFIRKGGRIIPIKVKAAAHQEIDKHRKKIQNLRKELAEHKKVAKGITKKDAVMLGFGASGIIGSRILYDLGTEITRSKQRALTRHAGPAVAEATSRIIREHPAAMGKTRKAKDFGLGGRDFRHKTGQYKKAVRTQKALRKGIKATRLGRNIGAAALLGGGSFLFASTVDKVVRETAPDKLSFYGEKAVEVSAAAVGIVGLRRVGRPLYKKLRKGTKAFAKTKVGKTALGRSLARNLGAKASVIKERGIYSPRAYKSAKKRWGGTISKNPQYRFSSKIEAKMKPIEDYFKSPRKRKI